MSSELSEASTGSIRTIQGVKTNGVQVVTIVDLIIASKSLYENGGIDDTGILDSPQEQGTSDHVPLWVKVKLGGNDERGLRSRS
jgi:hypothetical protein